MAALASPSSLWGSWTSLSSWIEWDSSVWIPPSSESWSVRESEIAISWTETLSSSWLETWRTSSSTETWRPCGSWTWSESETWTSRTSSPSRERHGGLRRAPKCRRKSRSRSSGSNTPSFRPAEIASQVFHPPKSILNSHYSTISLQQNSGYEFRNFAGALMRNFS